MPTITVYFTDSGEQFTARERLDFIAAGFENSKRKVHSVKTVVSVQSHKSGQLSDLRGRG
jgi:hypothetical protein